MKSFVTHTVVENPSRRTCPQEKRIVTASSPEEALSLARALLQSDGFVISDDVGDRTFAIEEGANAYHPIEIDIFAIEGLANLPTEGAGYCRTYSTQREHGGKTYQDWEKEIATPALEAAGFKLTWCWFDGEADSCGPLSRAITAERGGKYYSISYG